jgi:hypothetical protein
MLVLVRALPEDVARRVVAADDETELFPQFLLLIFSC